MLTTLLALPPTPVATATLAPLTHSAASTPAATPPWTDVWQAVGTVAGALATFLAVAVALLFGWLDRRNAERRLREEHERAAKDRAEAKRQLAEERAIATQRIADERALADSRIQDERSFLLQRDKQARESASAAAMLGALAELQPCAIAIPGFRHSPPPTSGTMAARLFSVSQEEDWAACEDAVRGLQRAVRVEAVLLGNPEVAARFRVFVHYVLSLARMDPPATPAARELSAGDLRNYIKWMRMNLQAVIDEEPIPAEEVPPRVHRMPGDGSLWSPTHVPVEWNDEPKTDPDDPMHRPAP